MLVDMILLGTYNLRKNLQQMNKSFLGKKSVENVNRKKKQIEEVFSIFAPKKAKCVCIITFYLNIYKRFYSHH